MKKDYLLFFLPFLFIAEARADTIVIDVFNNQFDPANVTVKVGDEVKFHFSEGYHNATSAGATTPGGAAAINSGSPDDAVRDYTYYVALPGVYNYYCEIHGGPGSGMAGMFTATSPLPVKLSEFEVATQADKFPMLRWTTLTEDNVSHFLVKSSTDGLHFKEIGRVNAQGISSSEQHYEFEDRQLSTAYRYVQYQLVIVDRNGHETYSSIKQYKNLFAQNALIVQLGPNPIKRPGQLMLQFNAESNGIMPVNVFDTNGRLVLKTTLRAVPGLNNGHVHVCDFSPGVYTMQFAFEGKTETKRIVVQ